MSGKLKHLRQMYILLYVHKSACAWCRRPVFFSNAVYNSFDDFGVENLPFQATRDHWIVKSKGGSGATRNMILACRQCNEERGSLSANRWRAILEKRGFKPLTDNRMRKAMYKSMLLHVYMGSRNLPLYAVEEAALALKQERQRFQCAAE